MLKFFKKMSLAPQGLRYKLVIAFSLMSIIPLLVCFYIISSYTMPDASSVVNIVMIVIISIVIAVLGFLLAKGLVEPVIEMAIEAKVIASGQFNREIMVSSKDEVGVLGESINLMTQKIRLNMDELKTFGQKTKELNMDIHKKVLAMSGLLQIGDIISGGSTELDAILDLSVQKVAMILEEGYCVFYMIPKEGSDQFLPKTHSKIDGTALLDIVIKKGEGLLGKIIKSRALTVIDRTAKVTREIEEFRSLARVNNIMAAPVYSGRSDLGLLLVGNRQDNYVFRPDDVDMINIFTKQITIAIENDIWVKKSEELSIRDDLTDLYNKNYILTALEDEIKRSIFYQRPCSFVVFNVDNFKKLRESSGELVTEEVIKKVAVILKHSLSPVDKAARISGDGFALLLPEKNKRQAAAIAEELRKKIETTNFSREGKLSVTVSGGVSENPIDGSTQEELFKKATEALGSAKSMGKNRVAA